MGSLPFSPVTLSGKLVRLEPLAAHHLDGLAEVAFDPELWRLTVTNITDRAALEAYVDSALEAAARGSALPFATVVASENRVIGSTRFANYDPSNYRVEIGWTWVAQSWQRSGLNVEAKLLMMAHAFEVLGCQRVEFKTDVLNDKSRNALRGIGAQEEGVLRAHTLLWSGRWRDTIYYSVLAPEWPAVKQLLLARLNRPAHRTGSATSAR